MFPWSTEANYLGRATRVLAVAKPIYRPRPPAIIILFGFGVCV